MIAKLDTVTERWWLYPMLVLLFFIIPPYASRGYYEQGGAMDLAAQALSNPLIYTFPALMPIAKAIPVVLIAGVMVFGNRMRRLFSGYAALLHIGLALFQTMAVTDTYGFVLISGNLVLILLVGLIWLWEFVVGRNDFSPLKRPLWRWWVAPAAGLALLAPIDPTTMSADFGTMRMLTNESGLTYCMMTPVILAVLVLFHPNINPPLLRVSSFVGIIFAAMNLFLWFVAIPSGWWMGVLHIPLLAVSVYGFVLGRLTTGVPPVTGSG